MKMLTFSENSEARDHFEDIRVGGRIIVKWKGG
jgi:hypothetical protein